MGFSQAPALPYNKLGIVEDGDTASQAIEKDKYVIWKGKNYFAKTDILQGETFVVDTNLTEIPDGALNGIIDALNASSTTSDITSQCNVNAGLNVHVYKSGKIIQITFACDSGIPSSGYGLIATLPNDSRPLGTTYAQLYNNANTSLGNVRIGTSGGIEAYNATGSLYGNVIFISA